MQLLSDQEKIRINNRNRIIRYLRQRRECTKPEIGLALDLSIPTVANNLKEMAEDGIINHRGPGESSGGRRPLLYRFNPGGLMALGIEITPHGCQSVILDLDGSVQTIRQLDEIPENGNELSQIVFSLQKEFLDFARTRSALPAGIGIALPGIIDPQSRYLITAPNLVLKSMDFQEIQSGLSIDLFLENEANAAAVAEKLLSDDDQASDLIYLSITEGVGAGIFLHDQLYRGRRNRAGEIGHMCLVPQGEKCNCGQRGCLERYISEKALLNAYQVRSGTGLKSLEDFFELLEKSDLAAIEVWGSYLRFLFTGIQNLLHIFDPRTVVIGGNLASYKQYLLPWLGEHIYSSAGLQHHSDVVIKCSALGANAALLGAGLLPLYQYF